MNTLLRLWVVWVVLLCALVWSFGLQPRFSGLNWPVAGFWAAAALAPFGLSVWTAGWLTLLGFVMDFVTNGPIGAWPLALLCAYGVALVAWDRQPPAPVVGVEALSVIGGLIAGWLALMAAGGVAGTGGFARATIQADFIVTALLYVPARFLLIPAGVRAARR